MDRQTSEVFAALIATLSPDREQRRQAEDFLAKVESQPGFAVMLLQLVGCFGNARTEANAQVRQHAASTTPESRVARTSAAVYLKVGRAREREANARFRRTW